MPIRTQVFQAFHNYVTLQFGARRPVAEGRRALRTVDVDQIGKARAGHAQMCAGALGPLVLQAHAVGADDVDCGEPASDRIEAGGQHQHIELDFTFARQHAFGRDALDRRFPQVH